MIVKIIIFTLMFKMSITPLINLINNYNNTKIATKENSLDSLFLTI